MSIQVLKDMKHSLISCAQSQMSDLKNADANELGAAIKMIKNLSESIYYCTVTEAMENKAEEKRESVNNINYYTMPRTRYYDGGWNDTWEPVRHMGPDTHGNMGGGSSGISYYEDGMNPYHMGTSPNSRKMYMEAKDMHKGSAVQMQELEHYMKDLSKDITDMISDSTPEEKLLLQQKLLTLANKIKPNNNV